MMSLVVAITAIFLVMILMMAVVFHPPLQDRKEIESNRVVVENEKQIIDKRFENLVEQKERIEKRLENLLEQETIIEQKKIPEPVAPVVVPQINNYNFENLSKALIFIVGGVFSIISLKLFIRFFNYYKTTRKFKKNTKKTQMLFEKLKTVFDNEKDFLLITDSIEHQLKMNDLLLKLDDSKNYGIELEVADDYLYTSYNFINKKLISNLK